MLAEAGQSAPRSSNLNSGEGVPVSSRGRLIRCKRAIEELQDCPLRPFAHFSRASPDGSTRDEQASEAELPRPSKARRAQSLVVVRERSEARQSSAFTPASRRATFTDKAFQSDSGSSRTGGIFKTAAVQVLRQKGRLMCTGDITKAAVAYGFVNVQGKTPDATMASALYTDIKRKEGCSVFIKPHEGLFGLREWLHLGYNFEDPQECVSAEDRRRAAQQSKQPCESLPQARGSRHPHLEGIQPGGRPAAMAGLPRRIAAARSQSAPLKLASQPEFPFTTNMDVLFAAVDEVMRDDATPASSDSAEAALRISSATTLSPSAVAEDQHSGQKPFAPPFRSDSRAELRSCSSSEAGTSPGDAAAASAAPGGLDRDLMARLAEVVRTLEASSGVDPSLVVQAHMQLCKLYGDAGMLEEACSSLSRAMEVGELARHT